MKNLLYPQICLSFAVYLLLSNAFSLYPATATETTTSAKYFTISGTFETSGMYCNGAPPPEKLIERLRAKKPLTGYKLYIRAGTVNRLNAPIIDSVVTDETGYFEFQLPPGEYILLSKNQLDRSMIRSCLHNEYIKITDFDCLEDWWQNGLAKLIIHNRPVNDLYFHLRKFCSLPLGVPCLQYTGPKPP